MSKNFKSILGAAVLAISSANTANAATLVVENGELQGATGVEVQGSLFDVSFTDGSCVSLFNGCNDIADFFFQTAQTAETASIALLDQVFLDGPAGQFDSDPELTRGIEFFNLGQIFTPYASDPQSTNRVLIARALNYTDQNQTDLASVLFDVDLAIGSSSTWAVWSASSVVNPPLSSVPLPAGGLLLLSGLGGIAALKRRKKNSTSV